MKKKLYRVEVLCEVVVVADSPEEAETLISEDSRAWRDELRDAEYSASEVTNMNQLRDDWRGAYPYGAGGSDHPCEFYLSETNSMIDKEEP